MPVIPLFAVVDNKGAVAFVHIGAIASKAGVIVFTFIVNVAVVAQMPAVGVKI